MIHFAFSRYFFLVSGSHHSTKLPSLSNCRPCMKVKFVLCHCGSFIRRGGNINSCMLEILNNMNQPLRTVRPIYRAGVPLPSKCCILYIFSTNISTEYFKHAAHSPFFFSKCCLFHNVTFFGFCIIHILHTWCAKF